ncbi:MAG TPA: rhomboid family intramembrane serine protease [Gaiellaceae bacterium]|nr:rhomboid family intramembrane serine protease [Gaiellaceae bacterium]
MTETETRYCYRHPDRETGLACSECGRPICPDCATFAAVGIRCPDHAGSGQRRATPRIRPRPVHRAPGIALATTNAPVTKALVAINVAIYLLGAAQGAGFNDPGGRIYAKLWLDAPDLYNGGWWRLVTTMFLHANVLHIGFNMLALYLIGTPVEQYLGRARYIGLYFVSGLAGSAGALLQTPGITVGASGAIFGILGAMLILEWQITGRLAGQAMTWIVINLAISFGFAGISWGGHIGGLIGGILVTLAYAHWRGGRAQYGQLGLGGVLGLVIVAAASVAIAYWRVRGYY